MTWIFDLPQIALLLNALFSFVMAVIVWRKRPATSSVPLSLLLFAIAAWSLFAALENAVVGTQHKIFFAQLEYFAIPQVPPLFLIFALQYSNLDKYITRRNKILLWIVPIITTGIALTNSYHRLLWNEFTPVPIYNELEFHHGTWFWINWFYSYVLLLFGTILIVRAAIRDHYLHRLHLTWMIIATLIPWLGNAIYLAGFIPVPGFDITPFAFALTGFLLALAMYRLRFLDLLPFARSKLVDTIPDAVFVLDSQCRVIDLNPASMNLIHLTLKNIIGKDAQTVLSNWSFFEKGFLCQPNFQNPDKQILDKKGRWYDLRISKITNSINEIYFWLIILRDITEQVKDQNALYDRTIKLQRRERLLSILNDITNAAIEMTDLSELSHIMVNKLGELLNADNCFLFLWNDDKKKFIHTSSHKPHKKKLFQEGIENTNLFENILTSGNIQILDDGEENIYDEIFTIIPGSSIMALPLIGNEQKLGITFISFINNHHFTPDEIRYGEQAAKQIALAIANSKALETARKRAKEAETLRLAGAAVATTLRQKEAIDKILEQLNYVVPYDSASVQLFHNNVLQIVGGRGFSSQSDVVGLKFPISGENPSAVVFDTRKPYILDDAPKTYPVFLEEPHKGIRGWMGIPLIVQDRLIGIISLDSSLPYTFTPDHERLAMSFADQVAILLENTKLYEEVHKLAITDSLTELHNRRHFRNLAQKEIARANRYGRSLALLMLDIDHFKRVNDTFGHTFGDYVLKTVAEICQLSLRKIDIIGRYGGEEFIVLLPETNNNCSFRTAERLRKNLSETIIQKDDISVNITISIGVHSVDYSSYHYPKDAPTLDKLIAAADEALYKAKQSGRNGVVQFT